MSAQAGRVRKKAGHIGHAGAVLHDASAQFADLYIGRGDEFVGRARIEDATRGTLDAKAASIGQDDRCKLPVTHDCHGADGGDLVDPASRGAGGGIRSRAGGLRQGGQLFFVTATAGFRLEEQARGGIVAAAGVETAHFAALGRG